MASLFPKRTRRDLKLKFKREERVNLHLVDKAVSQPMEFDFKVLEEEMKQDADLFATKAAEKEQLRKEIKEEKRRMTKFKRTLVGRNHHCYKSNMFKQFLDEDIGEFRTRQSARIKKSKRIKVKNMKELLNNVQNEDENIVLTKTKPNRTPKRLKSANCVQTEEIIKPKRRKTNTLKKKTFTEAEIDYNKCKKLAYLNKNGTVPGLFDEPWDLTVSPIPDIEENILNNSQEENESVSIISELGSSFVDEVNNMDSSTDNFVDAVESFTQQLESRSLPPYSSIGRHKKFEDTTPPVHSTLLNTRLLTESMKIIDQLTSNVVRVDDEDLVYIENEGCEEIGGNVEPVDSPALLSQEPVVVKIVPSNSGGEDNTSYFNVEIQMPFKIRQKQRKFAEVIQINQDDKNKPFDNFVEDKCSTGSNTLPQVTSIDSSVNENIVESFPNPEIVQVIEESKSKNLEILKDESNDLKNVGSISHSDQHDFNNCVNTSCISETNNLSGEEKSYVLNSEGINNCVNTSCISETNNLSGEEKSYILNSDGINNCVNTSCISETNNLSGEEKSYVLNSEGIIRTDDITMFIPHFEIISGESVNNNASHERNIASSANIDSTDNFIILEPINETTIEKEQSSEIIYSKLAQQEIEDDATEYILGE